MTRLLHAGFLPMWVAEVSEFGLHKTVISWKIPERKRSESGMGKAERARWFCVTNGPWVV